MIAPRRAISPGSNLWVSEASAVTLVSIIVFHWARSAVWAGFLPSARPALLIRRSMPRKFSGSAASAASRAASSRTSKAAGCTLSAPREATSASSRSARRPVAMTRQPAAENRRAAASPMPEVAPVMSAVLAMASPSAGAETRAKPLGAPGVTRQSDLGISGIYQDAEKALCWLSEQPLDGGANAAPFDRLDRRTRLRAERTERRELLPPEPRVSQKPHRSLARSARLSVGPGVGHDAEDLRVVADRVVAFGARAEIGVAIDPAAIEPEQRREREGEAGGRVGAAGEGVLHRRQDSDSPFRHGIERDGDQFVADERVAEAFENRFGVSATLRIG